ncbi:sensor histidine kinase [Pseudobutyrivibrio xylanivorans]|uniref:histidine kinase n=1 Tax=Pseudobutyrivibrio xylanivorans TaxID=185007 RepID=A0A1G5RSN6_PSEXY|nr:histidine kinase [Pseudobutyrivibrio xylanivorans]SCZ76309.1 Signal transduction histidine kinase [Pseudobutyrivibrio xylanivorans]
MLFDVIIRVLAALGLTVLINASGITTLSVVMSICVFLILEISLLFDNKWVYGTLSVIPFVITTGYVLQQDRIALRIFSLLVLAGFTLISTILYEQMMQYKNLLHRTRDDSKELEEILQDKNRRLMAEQDQQVHLATLAERNRIAREIHDNVGHLLSRAILLLGAINTVNKDEKLEPQLKMLADTLDESMAKMRASVHDLHDDSIDLKKNFDDIIGELKTYTVNTDLDLDEAIPTNVKLSLIGILKEAVTNILKHSNGDSVSIIMQKNYSFCTLSITDNGTISDAIKEKLTTENYEGIGLSNIKNRAASLGGDAYFYTDKGFTVFARLPL